MLVIKKWCANLWVDKVETAQISVKETAKRWTLIKAPNDEKTLSARGFKTTFEKDPPQLFDTEMAALEHLRDDCDAHCCVAMSTFNRRKKSLLVVIDAIKLLHGKQ